VRILAKIAEVAPDGTRPLEFLKVSHDDITASWKLSDAALAGVIASVADSRGCDESRQGWSDLLDGDIKCDQRPVVSLEPCFSFCGEGDSQLPLWVDDLVLINVLPVMRAAIGAVDNIDSAHALMPTARGAMRLATRCFIRNVRSIASGHGEAIPDPGRRSIVGRQIRNQYHARSISGPVMECI